MKEFYPDSPKMLNILSGHIQSKVIKKRTGYNDVDTCSNSVIHRKPNEFMHIQLLSLLLHPAQEYISHMETSPIPVKGCKI
jgi:hypothetical protein